MNDEKDVQDIRERLIKIETMLENYNKNNDLKMTNLEEKIKVANNRIKDLENNNQWLWRTVIGGVLTGAVAILFRFI